MNSNKASPTKKIKSLKSMNYVCFVLRHYKDKRKSNVN